MNEGVLPVIVAMQDHVMCHQNSTLSSGGPTATPLVGVFVVAVALNEVALQEVIVPAAYLEYFLTRLASFPHYLRLLE
jgi:hypothetical protein